MKRVGPLVALVILIAGCTPLASTHVPPTRVPTVIPSATPIPPPRHLLTDATLLTIYGRSFGVFPILGRLGMDTSFDDLAQQVQPFVRGVRSANGGKRVLIGVHLIYGLAKPCDFSPNCLSYLDDTGVNIVRKYIEPAARRGWLVILDDQLGRSNPAAEVRRMSAKGYFRYDNVEVAVDPEFRTMPGQFTPGIPIGSVTSAEVNAAQEALSQAVMPLHLPHRKLLLVHEFQAGMIANRQSLRENVPGVDPVIVADGFGDPGSKADTYATLFAGSIGRVRWPGIKLFYPNQYEQAGHGDAPLMTWAQVFGRAPAYSAYEGRNEWVRPPPAVVIIA